MASFCGQTEKVGTGEVSRWGISDLTWSISRTVPAIATQQAALLDAVFAGWSSVCGLSFKQIEDESRANIVFSAMRGQRAGFDGPRGTLAFAYLPSGSNFRGQLGCYFDLDEQWTPQADGSAAIAFVNVAAHEIGHNLGLDHSSLDSDLMAPTYNVRIASPQKGDIARVVELYGPPKSQGVKPPADQLAFIKTVETRLLINGIDVGTFNKLTR